MDQTWHKQHKYSTKTKTFYHVAVSPGPRFNNSTLLVMIPLRSNQFQSLCRITLTCNTMMVILTIQFTPKSNFQFCSIIWQIMVRSTSVSLFCTSLFSTSRKDFSCTIFKFHAYICFIILFPRRTRFMVGVFVLLIVIYRCAVPGQTPPGSLTSCSTSPSQWRRTGRKKVKAEPSPDTLWTQYKAEHSAL